MKKKMYTLLSLLLLFSMNILPVFAAYRFRYNDIDFSVNKAVCLLPAKNSDAFYVEMDEDRLSFKAKHLGKQDYLDNFLSLTNVKTYFRFYEFNKNRAWESSKEKRLQAWSGFKEFDERNDWLLPIFPLVEEKKNGTAMAAVQMLLAYRQEYFSTEELAEKLHYQESKGVDFEKILPVLNQALWGVEQISPGLTGYQLNGLEDDYDAEDVDFFKDGVYTSLFVGYPAVAEISGKAGLTVDKSSDFSRTVLIVGVKMHPNEDEIQGIYYIEPHINFQKAYWGGLHYLPAKEFVDAIHQSKSRSWIVANKGFPFIAKSGR